MKALAEIYTKHSFVPCLESIIENWGRRTRPKQPRKGEHERPLSSNHTLLRTSAKGDCKEKIARIKIA